MTHTKRSTKILLCIGTVLAFLLATPGAAQAAWAYQRAQYPPVQATYQIRKDCISATSKVFSCFTGDQSTYGEIMALEDLASDGRRVGAHWWTGDKTYTGICYNIDGMDPAGDPDWRFCDLPDIPEGKTVYYEAGTCDGSIATDYCAVTSHWTWGGPVVSQIA